LEKSRKLGRWIEQDITLLEVTKHKRFKQNNCCPSGQYRMMNTFQTTPQGILVQLKEIAKRTRQFTQIIGSRKAHPPIKNSQYQKFHFANARMLELSVHMAFAIRPHLAAGCFLLPFVSSLMGMSPNFDPLPALQLGQKPFSFALYFQAIRAHRSVP
jgi:hypothetical protein